MMAKSVYCIATSDTQAVEIVNQLKVGGFSSADISVLFPDKSGTRDFAHEQRTKAPEGTATGAGVGAAVGGAFGWLASLGVLAIPGAGPFIAAGPILAALGGIGAGGLAGGIAGGLIGLGVPEYEAKRYEGKIKDGNILISVHSPSRETTERARSIFEEAHAQDIAYTSESRVKR
jgi:hypothetical protein